MVAALLPHIGPLVNKPFAFFGHSNGGLVSFEVARALQRAGNEWQAHHFISGKGAIHLPRNRRELHNLPDEEFIKELESLGGTPDELLMCRDLMSIFMPILRADFSLNEAFNYKSDIRLKSDVSLLCGQYDKGFSEDSVAKWSDLIDGEMDITVYDGDHFFINSKRQDVLNFINGKLVSILAEINKEARYA
jgi:medium-chain acyl-[acyl-carrier-protein] hydrolase